ncbi:MAG: nucleoside hydrolase [Verrucomicrobiota bacterium]|nr:nucleoside hydrolase [Verrucomicrobiota bacterium]
MHLRTFALALAVLWLITCRIANAATAVWIDTDPAIGAPWREVDDAFALVLAFHSPELRIVGVSSTYGNAALPRTTAVARDLVGRFGGSAHLAAADVHPGAASPADRGVPTEATEALASALRAGKLTYLAIGPLTNLATFLQLHPDLATQFERVVFVGGRSEDRPLRFGPARRLSVHDANVFKDPAAPAAVLRANVPLTLASIETAPELPLTSGDVAQLGAGGPAGDYLQRHTRVWLWFWRRFVREKGGLVFDVLAVLPAIRPELLRTEERFLRVDHGELLAARRSTPGARRARFSVGVAPAAKALVVRRLAL